MWNFIMHLPPLLFLSGFAVIVPAIYLAIGIIIVMTRPAAKAWSGTPDVSPWLLAWIEGEGTRVIQLAMFSLLLKKYLRMPQPARVQANECYANGEMNVLERMLYVHFDTPKPCHQDLPDSLNIARTNLWQAQIRGAGLALNPLCRGYYLLLIGVPTLALGIVAACKILIYNNIADSIFSWLLLLLGCMLWLPLWFSTLWQHHRLELNGISHNNAHACIAALREKLASSDDGMDSATAMLCLALNGVDALADSYREYKDLLAPISFITSRRTED